MGKVLRETERVVSKSGVSPCGSMLCDTILGRYGSMMTDQRKDITKVQLGDLMCLLWLLTGKGQEITHRAGMAQRHLQYQNPTPAWMMPQKSWNLEVTVQLAGSFSVSQQPILLI